MRPLYPLLGRCVGRASIRADPGWVGAVLQAALWPPWERNFSGGVGGESISAGWARLSSWAPRPLLGCPSPAPLLWLSSILTPPSSVPAAWALVSCGFFPPWNAPKNSAATTETPSELTSCVSTRHSTGAVRPQSPPRSLQQPDCNFAGKRGCSLRAPDTGLTSGILIKFPKPTGKQAPS